MSVATAEHLSYLTPLGIVFVDGATKRRVSDGLTVRVEGVTASINRSGVFVVPHLRGLGEAERGEGDDAFWGALPVQKNVRVEIDDLLGRFLPFGFDAEVPARGLFSLRCPSSPPGLVAPIELFSAPSRPIPAGTAVVRAELWDATAAGPAAWALLEASVSGLAPARGLADERGRATILFPYPEPAGLDGSPPSLERRALTAQTWTVELCAFAAQQPEVPAPRPDLCSVLAQPPANLLADEPPGTAVIEATLEYGRELVVRTSSKPTLDLIPSAL